MERLFVPEHRSVTAWAMNGKPHPGSAVNQSPLLRLPCWRSAYVLSGVMLGCAQGAYEVTVGAARKRNATTTGQPVGASQTVQIKVAEAGARIDAAEMIMRAVCSHAMEVARAGREPAHDDKLRYRRDAFFSVRMCLEAVDILMGVAGSSGLYLTNRMQRLFRDAHAANAHVMFSPDLQGPCSVSTRLAWRATAPAQRRPAARCFVHRQEAASTWQPCRDRGGLGGPNRLSADRRGARTAKRPCNQQGIADSRPAKKIGPRFAGPKVKQEASRLGDVGSEDPCPKQGSGPCPSNAANSTPQRALDMGRR